MSKITELASGAITAADTITIELVETSEHPTVVIIRWPDKPSVIHPRRFPDVASAIARLFAEAHATLVGSKLGDACNVTADLWADDRVSSRTDPLLSERGVRRAPQPGDQSQHPSTAAFASTSATAAMVINMTARPQLWGSFIWGTFYEEAGKEGFGPLPIAWTFYGLPHVRAARSTAGTATPSGVNVVITFAEAKGIVRFAEGFSARHPNNS